MNEFASELKKIRQESPFSSAKEFYLSLTRSAEARFNYAYYMKMEAGKTLPSAQVVQSIASLLGAQGDRIVIAYCRTLFPTRPHVFRSVPSHTVEIPESEKSQKSALPGSAQLLTESQVATICSSQLHYYLFLILALARAPVSESTLNQHFVKPSRVGQALQQLSEKKLCRSVGNAWESTSSEHKFPRPESASMKRHYQAMAPWDYEFRTFFKFEKNFDRTMVRRISVRNFGLVLAHCQLLTDLLRASEETNPALNEETVFFELKCFKGKLPG